MTKIIQRDAYGKYRIEQFQLKAKDQTDIAITHVCGSESGHPIILLHGSYSNRHFWLSPKGVGLAAFLTDNGYNVWIPEFRGHGYSPKTKNFSHFSVEQQMQYDIPAFSAFIYKKTQRAAFWLGHSLGGLSLYGSVSRGWLNTKHVKGLITVGSQITEGDRYLKIIGVPFFANRLLDVLKVFPAKLLGLGPENEAAGVVRDVISWKRKNGDWSSADGTSFWKGFSKITRPCLVIASRGDKTDPFEGCKYLFDQLGAQNKKFILLGVNEGFSKNYNHVEMVIDKCAQQEVWPLILAWLNNETT